MIDDVEAHREYFPSGQIKSEFFTKDGKREGWHRLWYDNGQLLGELKYGDDKSFGVLREWTKTGQLTLLAHLEGGELHGHYQSWWDDGRPHEEGDYQQGKPQPGYRWYGVNGKRWRELNADGSVAWHDRDVTSSQGDA